MTAAVPSRLGKNDLMWLTGITALALALRIAFVHFVQPSPISDFEWYYRHALQIDAGRGFTTNGYPTAYWPPGWPYFLAGGFAVFGASVHTGELAQAVLNGLTAGLVFLLAFPVAGSRCAIAAALLYALLPSAIEWCAMLASEPLYTFLVILASCMWVWMPRKHSTWLAGSGVVIGVAALVRPTALVMPGILLLYLWLTSRKRSFGKIVVPPLLVVLCASVVLAPYEIRNYRVFHHFVLICNTGGLTLWSGNNPYFRPGDYLLYHKRLGALAKDPRTEYEADQLADRMAISYITSHTARTASLALPKLRSLYGTDDGQIAYIFRTGATASLARTMKRVTRIYYYCMLFFAFAGFLLCLPNSRRVASQQWLFVLLCILCNSAPFLIVPAYDRYHFSIMPYVAVFAGLSLALFFSRVERWALRPSYVRSRANAVGP